MSSDTDAHSDRPGGEGEREGLPSLGYCLKAETRKTVYALHLVAMALCHTQEIFTSSLEYTLIFCTILLLIPLSQHNLKDNDIKARNCWLPAP